MRLLPHLFENNQRWAEAIERDHPGFFDALSKQQAPTVLWIGCSDSRVPANQITGLMPGEVFVHRNVANVLAHSDLNALAVLQYAVEVLKVEHVVVCGHYGCGGVRAALDEQRLGLIDNWLLHVKDVRWKHRAALDALDDEARFRRLCELNVIEQVANVCETTIAIEAWGRAQPLSVHGWIYDLHDGRLCDLNVTANSAEEFHGLYEAALT
jgi:carbonic anhydrase